VFDEQSDPTSAAPQPSEEQEPKRRRKVNGTFVGPINFIANKYRRWYYQIMARARERGPIPDADKHHVYPFLHIDDRRLVAGIIFIIGFIIYIIPKTEERQATSPNLLSSSSTSAVPVNVPEQSKSTQAQSPVGSSKPALPSQHVEQPRAIPHWDVTEERSKIDDSKNVFVHLRSKEPIKNQYGMTSDIDLWIMCREKKTDLYMVFGDHFMSSLESWGLVTYRVDKKPAVKKQFTESTDHKALGLWGANSVTFIKMLLGGETLFVRAVPFNENAVTAEFNIAGIDEAIRPLRAACGWSEPGSLKPGERSNGLVRQGPLPLR
jgi:type VI secretion system protein VasI